ncbi:hypothetical protein HNR29_004409 [Rhizobium leguminosarum]|nr:hypothetical protein [Rhizobium leguminosarum]
MAIVKLVDPHRRPATATTFNYPPRHMAILPSALSHPLHHSKLRPPATRTEERGTIDIAWTDEPIDAARAPRMPDWQPSPAAPLRLLLRRAAGARRTEPPPTDLLGPKHRHEPDSLTPRDGRPRLPPLQRDAKAATATPRRRPAIPVADPIRRVELRAILLFIKAVPGSGERDPVGRPDRALRRHWSRIPPRPLGEAQETAALRYQVARYRAYFPGRANQLLGYQFMCKRPDSCQADHPVVRGQRQDQANIWPAEVRGFA